MPIENTLSRYGAVTIIFHWTIAVLIFVNLGLGWYIATLPDIGFNLKKIYLILIHKEMGMYVLLLVIPRLLWRFIQVVPLLPTYIPYWQVFIAHLVHWVLYGLMLALPVSGWLMSSAADFPITLLNTMTLPYLIHPNVNLIQYYINWHTWLAYVLMVALCMHVGAALDHHFIHKDNILKRMLFWR